MVSASALKRRVTDNDGGPCLKNCPVCLRMQLQVKWVVSASVVAIAVIGSLAGTTIVNRSNISGQAVAIAVTATQNEYMVTSINEIKKAMGLEVRMPAKLEALKGL